MWRLTEGRSIELTEQKRWRITDTRRREREKFREVVTRRREDIDH